MNKLQQWMGGLNLENDIISEKTIISTKKVFPIYFIIFITYIWCKSKYVKRSPLVVHLSWFLTLPQIYGVLLRFWLLFIENWLKHKHVKQYVI